MVKAECETGHNVRTLKTGGDSQDSEAALTIPVFEKPFYHQVLQGPV
jgi:hypothetical protein